MSKNTPGPWRYSKENGSPTTGQHMIAGAKPGYLAEVRDCGSGCVEANARLIAAAPELLEACQTFAEWLRREDEGFPEEIRFNTPEGEAKWREWYGENLRVCALAMEKARSAIAKARGDA